MVVMSISLRKHCNYYLIPSVAPPASGREQLVSISDWKNDLSYEAWAVEILNQKILPGNHIKLSETAVRVCFFPWKATEKVYWLLQF